MELFLGYWTGALLAALGSASILWASTPSCLTSQPLLQIDIGPYDLPIGSSVFPLGEWKLPVSVQHPEKLSSAKLKLELRRDPAISDWILSVVLHYDTPPDIVGLPFSFQQLNANAIHVDWSHHCQNPGRSIFPGQKFSDQLRMSGYANRKSLPKVKIRLWGSQN